MYMEQPLSVGKSVKAQVTFLNPSGWVGKLLGEGQLAWGGKVRCMGQVAILLASLAVAISRTFV